MSVFAFALEGFGDPHAKAVRATSAMFHPVSPRMAHSFGFNLFATRTLAAAASMRRLSRSVSDTRVRKASHVGDGGCWPGMCICTMCTRLNPSGAQASIRAPGLASKSEPLCRRRCSTEFYGRSAPASCAIGDSCSSSGAGPVTSDNYEVTYENPFRKIPAAIVPGNHHVESHQLSSLSDRRDAPGAVESSGGGANVHRGRAYPLASDERESSYGLRPGERTEGVR